MEIKLYTTYFANLKKIPKNIIPVAICQYPPRGYKGILYKALAPTFEILSNFKEGSAVDEYVERYHNEILGKLKPDAVIDDLLCMTGLKHGPNRQKDSIALVCYEKPEDFCHRHLVAEWLQKNGYEIEEIR